MPAKRSRTGQPPADSVPAKASSHELPERVVRTMPWAVLGLDHQGVLRLLNPQAEWLLGRPAAAVLNQPLAQALPTDFPPELAQALHAAIGAAGPVTGTFFLPHCQRWIEMTTEPGATEVLVYWQDITRLMEQHQQYQALADNTPDVLTRWSPDLRLRYANPALVTQTGQPVAALLGKTFPEMGAPRPLPRRTKPSCSRYSTPASR